MKELKQPFFEVMATFNKRLSEFENELKKSPSSSSTAIASDFETFKSFTVMAFQSVQQQLAMLAQSTDAQEMRSRRKILLMHGVPEDKKDDTSAAVIKTISSYLKISEFTVNDISRCHRMGRSSSVDKPRPILVKLSNVTIRDKVWFSKKMLKGSGITISEFLTKPRHDAFMAARERFGITKCWTRDGYVHIISSDGKRHRVSNVAELNNIVVPVVPKPAVNPTPKENIKEAAAPKQKRNAGVSRK